MSSPSSRPSQLGSCIDLAVQLQRDADRPEAELHRRDRAIARALDLPATDRRTVLTAWLDAVRRQGDPLPGRGISLTYRLVVVALVFLGLLLGWGTVGALFYYEGARPVNVVHVLAVLVLTQVALLGALGIVLLPYSWTRHLPGLAGLQELLAWLSPGQLVRLAVHRLPAPLRDRLKDGLHQHAGFFPAVGRAQKWAVVFGAQCFAVAFNVAAITAMLYQVTFSDLAFSWSTTLEPNVAVAHRWTSTLAVPWASLVPAAVPSPELIRQTLYYRQTGPPSGIAPARWGEWWPFLVACVATYGLLPRVVLLIVAGLRFRRALRQAFLDTPGASVLLDRLTSARVTTQSAEAELEPEAAVVPASGPAPAASLASGPLVVVNWGGLEVPDAPLRERVSQAWRREVLRLVHAGGRQSVEDDARTVAAIAGCPGAPATAVLVKAWEPPVLDFTDFLRDLRQAIGPQRLILVAPVAIDEGGGLVAPRTVHAAQWQQRLRRLGDPALVVRPWLSEGGHA